jgi:hypothetical protein
MCPVLSLFSETLRCQRPPRVGTFGMLRMAGPYLFQMGGLWHMGDFIPHDPQTDVRCPSDSPPKERAPLESRVMVCLPSHSQVKGAHPFEIPRDGFLPSHSRPEGAPSGLREAALPQMQKRRRFRDGTVLRHAPHLHTPGFSLGSCFVAPSLASCTWRSIASVNFA